MERVLVTGANGYLGAQISRYLSQQGYAVSGLCYPQIPDDVSWRNCFEALYAFDIRDVSALEQLASRGFHSIIHLVALDHRQSEGDADVVRAINVTPTKNLLTIFSGRGLRKFIYFSTIHVYGKMPEGIVTEDYKIHPANGYAETHYESEEICRQFAASGGLNGVVVRLSNSYGPPVFSDNNCWWLVVNDLCRSAFENKKITLQSDGSPLRDFVHGRDVCQGVEILLNKGTNGATYHISSGVTCTLLELAGKVRQVYRRLYGDTLPVSTAAQANVTDFDGIPVNGRYVIANDKLKALGFTPAYDMEQGIVSLFRYLEAGNANKQT